MSAQYFEFQAPAEWQAIDFISDLHLCAALARTFDAFAQHLRHTRADAVFILGDLFEAWVGDDARGLPFEQQCMEVLADAASHRRLAFMVGNRDFLLGDAMLKACGMAGLPDPTLLSAWGSRILLSHGDALCLADSAYQALRIELRSSTWRQAFLARPLADRLQAAADMRALSRQRHLLDGDPALDIDVATAVRWMHLQGAAQLVHGHTHRPGSNLLAPGFKRHVLSDWDLDSADTPPRAEVLRLTRDGFQRMAPSSAAQRR